MVIQKIMVFALYKLTIIILLFHSEYNFAKFTIRINVRHVKIDTSLFLIVGSVQKCLIHANYMTVQQVSARDAIRTIFDWR